MKCQQIAIDGPAASGKSTVAKRVAEKLDGFYVNTGDMYRALTLLCIEAEIDVEDEDAVGAMVDKTEIHYVLDDTRDLSLIVNDAPADIGKIRSPEVVKYVSQVAKIPVVRTWMVESQRHSAELGLIIMEGRDIGTVVFPDAEFKFFVTATPEERARRRLAQPGEIVDGATLAVVAEEIARRDKMDSERKVAPLKAADDAVYVDTTEMSIDEVVAKVCGIIENGM